MRTEELIERISKHEPLLAKAVSHMVAYVQDRYPSTFPSKEQTMAVNEYLHSWKIQCKLPPKTKRFCPLVLK